MPTNSSSSSSSAFTTVATALVVLLLILVTTSYSPSSSPSTPVFVSALEGIDGRDAWPPVAPRINATVSPWLVWTFDWTIVGCSFFSAFGGLANGHMASLTIQRFRALRQPISQQCTWKKQYEALIATENNTSILDRADTPVGLAIEVEGGYPERFIVGAFWFNFVLGIVILLLQIAVAHGLEKYTAKKAIERAGGNKEEANYATNSYTMENPKHQFFYIANKWGFGRCLTGVVVLPFYSAFRLAMIILGNGTSSDSVLLQARLAVALHLIIIALWMLIAPSMASRRCFAQSRSKETDSLQKKSFLAWLMEDKVRWRFEKIDDFRALIVVASIENINKESYWWAVPIELFATAAIDLFPLATTNPNDETNACFTNCLTGLILTTVLWWFILYLRPFQRRLQHMCWFIQLSAQNFSYLFGVLQEQQTAPVPQKRLIFIVLCFVACFTTMLVTFLFTFMGVIRRIVTRFQQKNETGVAMTFNWDAELLGMLQQDQALKSDLDLLHTTGGGGHHGDNDDIELGNDLDIALNETKSSNKKTNSLALPSEDYAPASKAEFTLDDEDFLTSFLGTNNNNSNKPNAIIEDDDEVPPPPSPPADGDDQDPDYYDSNNINDDTDTAPPPPLEDQEEAPDAAAPEYNADEDEEGYYDEDGVYHYYESDDASRERMKYAWL